MNSFSEDKARANHYLGYDLRKLLDNNALICNAYDYAIRCHQGQFEDTGKPYIIHPCQVVNLLYQLTQDEDILSAGFLHDVIEDCGVTHEDLKNEFNERIADLVYEVTHDGEKDEVGYYFPRLKSRDAILIKLCDRASNISRMENWDKKRQEHYLKKTKFWKSSPGEI